MFTLPQKTLKHLLSKVHFAMAVHDIRYYLNGILFVAEGKTADARWPPTATAWRWRRPRKTEQSPRQEVILPRKTVLELQRLLPDNDDADRDAVRRQPGQVQRSAAWSSSPSWSRASSPTTTA